MATSNPTLLARAVLGLLSLGLALAAPACSEPEPSPEPSELPPYIEEDLGGEAVAADFTLTVDTAHAALEGRDTLEPIAGPATVDGSTATLSMEAFVKRIPARPELVWVEVFLTNADALAVADVELVVTDDGGADVYDLTNDPYAEASDATRIDVGNLGPEGQARVILGLPNDGSVHRLSLSLAGTTTSRTARSSAPLAITPDGAQVWAVVPDADGVAVVDTAEGRTLEVLDTGDRPTSVALTPDGAFAAVTSADSNEIHVFDVARRALVASFDEEDGIGRDPRHVVAAPDGSRFYVSAFVGDRITEIVRTDAGFYADRSVDVGRRPLGLGVSLDGSTITVAHFLPRGRVTDNEGWLSVIETEGLTLAREVTLQDDFNAEEAECLTTIFPVSASRLTSEAIPTQLAGVFLPPSGNMAWVPGSQVGPVPVWEKGPEAVELSVAAVLRPAEVLASFVYLLDARRPRETTPMLHPALLDPPDAKLDYLTCAHTILAMESLPRDVLAVDANAYINRGVTMPTPLTGTNVTGISRFVGFSRGARRALVLSYMADEIAVVDTMTMHGTAQDHFPLSGANPSGLVVSNDGTRTYVAYDNSTFLSVVDSSALAGPDALPGPRYTRYAYADVEEFPAPPTPYTGQRLVRYIDDMPERPPLAELAPIPLVDTDPMDPVQRRGKILFSSSNPSKYTVSASKIGSCGSCHPMGLTDGSVWGTMEGERRTTMLAGGVAGRGWLHASGTHADADEFVDIIVKERLAGELDAADHEALVQYIAFGIPRLQAPPTDPERVARGQALFEAHCTSCHAGERMTSGAPDPDSPLGGGLPAGPLLHDVGTKTDDAHAVLGTFFQSLLPPTDSMLLESIRGDRDLGTGDWVQETLDFRPRPDRKAGMLKAPTLTNVWHNVLFFHDGRFDRLEDVVAYFDDHLALGLSEDDRTALVEYLKTL